MGEVQSWKAGVVLLMTTFCQGLIVPHPHGNNGTETSRQDATAILSPDTFAYHVKLDENYHLRWDFNSSHIIFEAHVKTNGYIGFGISNHGTMFPSDVIIAWVKDGHVHFADRHATGHSTPAVDIQQDWHLISGTEKGKHTTITMLRKLNTCDEEDFAIQAGTTRLIYSYSPVDPMDENNIIHYHGNTRGTKSVLLLDPPAQETNRSALPDDVTTIDFLNNNYSVPSTDTTYSCTIKKLPPLKDKHHVIRFGPVVQVGHERLVHHMVLYFCTEPVDANLVDKVYTCYRGAPSAVRKCQHMFLSWAIGGKAFDFPPHVGHAVGGPQDPVFFKLEVHYDNLYKKNDLVDNSGFRLYLTKRLRQHDSGTLEAGVKVTSYQIIPPYNDNFMSKGYCHQDCLAQALGDGEIHVFADFLHTHLLGTSVKTRHIRNGTELPPLMEDMHFDFDYQEIRPLREERVVKKGDSLITECFYDSSNKTTITYGGLSTSQEMCLSVLMYYPRKPLNLCVSRTKYQIPREINRRGIFDFVKKQDWTKKEVHAAFAKLTEESKIVNTCIGPGNSKLRYKLTIPPNVTDPYQPAESDHCNAGH